MRIRSFFIFAVAVFVCLLAVEYGFRPNQGKAEEDTPDIIAPEDKDTCLACHGEKVNEKHLAVSAHGKLNCQSCHKGVNQYPHPEQAIAKKPSCNTCHTREASMLGKSIHAHGRTKNGQAPDCRTCHGGNPHEIVKPSTLTMRVKEASCANCHKDMAKSLSASVHGHTTQRGAKAIGCMACHGGNPHSINTPVKVASAQQDATCRRCHAADVSKMMQSAHGKAGKGSDKQLNCMSCHGSGNPHAISMPAALTGAEKNAMCQSCHADVAKGLNSSVHGNTDMEAANHPNCITCHGENLHSVTPVAKLAPTQKDASCKKCHNQIASNLANSVHGHQGKKFGGKAPSCLSCHEGNPHTIHSPAKQDRVQNEAACKKCHTSLATALTDSVHDKADKQPGDHPTCVSCHGGLAHSIAKPAKLTPLQKIELCSKCHADKELMGRYGRTDAVEAYEATYHGRAILKLHKTEEATCVDCHGIHGVLAQSDPRSPTNPQHAAAICGKCHSGNSMNFAYSYATHMRMKVEKTLIDPAEQILYKLLKAGALFGLFGLLGFGIWKRTTRSGVASAEWVRDTYTGICLLALLLSLTVLLTALSMAVFGLSGAMVTVPAYAAVCLLVLSGIGYAVKRLFFPCAK
ncbi:MAG: cytochrome c3 family protein [Armatimonadota bacterium]